MRSGAIRVTPTRSSSVRRAASKSLPRSGGDGRRQVRFRRRRLRQFSKAGRGTRFALRCARERLNWRRSTRDAAGGVDEGRTFGNALAAASSCLREPRSDQVTMANQFRTLDSHSAEHFGDTRDHWWNLDFLELMARRLSFDRVRDVLDVGCGVGHWGRLLAQVLPATARVQGVDRDPHWVEHAAARVSGLGGRFSYQVAVAERLPFADASFDLVTCQTVLIHAPDPGAVIDEMIRVTRPGGLLLAAEPNNIANALVFDSVNFHDPVDEVVARVRLQLICERGKAALGEGHNSIGDLLPGLFAERNLGAVCAY